MNLSRRTVLKLGLGAGAVPLLGAAPARAFDLALNPGEDPGENLKVRAMEDRILRARRLPLDKVRLTGGPLKVAQDTDHKYLLELEPDRMLAYFRERAGLKPKAEPYGGWDGGGRNLTGHICGHYLSGVSLMYAATGDERLKGRADYIVDELKVVQDKNGDGYLVALENGRKAFGDLAKGEIRSAAFDLNGLWSPWYTLHKLFAGLRDAYRFTGNDTALDVEAKFAAWAEGIVSGLSDEQIQHMLNTEFGGMNETLVDLYADTDDERWLALSWKFEHRAFVQPLQRAQDDLGGKHGNTQIPKIIGSADRFGYTGNGSDLQTASFFWEMVAQHHSFSTGGDGKDEYFGPSDKLSDMVNGRTAETCNVYNMLKLTRRLFTMWPDPYYADWHERALFNHILGSIDPKTGEVTYMNPVGQGVTREYQDMFHSFTCDVGTGMESHALHGDGVFCEDGEHLWWNLYMPCTADWDDAGVHMAMATDFPNGESAKLTLTLEKPRKFTLMVRRPYWVTDDYAVEVNGRPFQEPARYDGGLYKWPFPVGRYLKLDRTWKSGDVVEVRLPKSLRLEPLPDNPGRVAIMWGPLVLAGDLGPDPRFAPGGERRRVRGGRGARPKPPVVPIFVAGGESVDTWLEPVAGEPGHFRSKGAGREPDAKGAEHEVDFYPFWSLQERTYSTYWDLFTPEEWEKQKAEYAAEAEWQRKLEEASVASVQAGEIMFERQYDLKSGDEARPVRVMGRPGRTTRSWFSYDIPVHPAHPMALVVTYNSGDRRSLPASFEIQVDGERIARQTLPRSGESRFFDVTYPIPAALVKGKEKVTVRFQADEDSQVATVFNVRMVRADQLK